MFVAEIALASSEFEIYVPRPIETTLRGSVETVYKPLAPVEQNDLECVITGD